MINSSVEACNIDQSGIKLRKKAGFVLILLGDMLSVLYVINFLQGFFIILIFIIYFGGILNLLQAQQKFCVLNAINGYDGVTKTKDSFIGSIKQRKILKIFLQTSFAALAITTLVYTVQLVLY